MILTLLRKLMATKYGKHIGLDLGVLGLALLSFFAYKHFTHNPVVSTVQVTPDVKVVTVDKPVLTEKVVEKIVSDPKDKASIAALLAENKKLKADVTTLTASIATLKTSGSGVVVAETVPSTVPGVAPTVDYHFKDFRLDFKTDTKTATYDLNQKFSILTTTSKQKDGQPVSLVKLFELDGDGNRIPVADVQTTAVFADQTTPHWMLHLNVQAGAVFSPDANGGIVALQWLKHGRTKATEDIKYAVLSPGYFVAQTVKEPALLPFSVNLGTIPHQPLTNLWLSPYIGFDVAKRTGSRVGVAITATF